jgi:tetratricopeptide (TPR) repeat protein
MLASAYNDLGTAEARQQQYALAVSHFQQAERWDKPSPSLLRNLGIAAFRSENFPEASRALGLYLHPAGATEVPRAGEERTQLVYALSLFSLGDFASASRAFAAASELALQDPRAAYSWAFSLAHSGGNTQANQIATTLSTQALPPDVLLLVCHLFVDTENYEASIPCYRKAYAADPALKLAHYQVAESLIRLDRPAEAIPELKQELTLSPDDPNVQYSLAFALLQTSDRTAALALLQHITAAHPEHAQAQYQLGKLMLESGDVAGAIGHLELSERADNSPDYVHYQLGSAYRKASRVADSDRELKMYREIKDRNRDSKAIPQTQ